MPQFTWHSSPQAFEGRYYYSSTWNTWWTNWVHFFYCWSVFKLNSLAQECVRGIPERHKHIYNAFVDLKVSLSLVRINEESTNGGYKLSSSKKPYMADGCEESTGSLIWLVAAFVLILCFFYQAPAGGRIKIAGRRNCKESGGSNSEESWRKLEFWGDSDGNKNKTGRGSEEVNRWGCSSTWEREGSCCCRG